MAAPVTKFDPGCRHWQPEELEAICRPIAYGGLAAIAQRLDRPYERIVEKRSELQRAVRARAASGAFLPDDGLPYRARMARIFREAS